MTAFDTSDRFLRPDDLRLIRRNRRQLQAERLLALGGRVLFAFLLLLLAWWIYQRTQQDARFAIRSVELAGVKHTPRNDLASAARSYVGRNLFKLDIERLQRDFGALPWVERVSVEKKLPGILKITIVERKPVALASVGGVPYYVDPRGRAFAELSPAVGNPDLPLITGARDDALTQCVRFLGALQLRHPALYSRVSEVSPAGESGFVVFDRDLKTRIYLRGEDAAPTWQKLYAIVAAEGWRSRPTEYVDLRFDDRIIVKPVEVNR